MQERVNEFLVQFLNIICQRFMPDSKMNLILVLQGEITLSINDNPPQVLKEYQLQAINRNAIWQIDGAQENIVVIITVSPLWLIGGDAALNQHLFTIDHDRSPFQASRLCALICHIATLWLKQNSKIWRLEANRALLEIVAILIEHFESLEPPGQKKSLTPRINKIVAWVEEHYAEPISLQQLAATLHVSTSHLSRQFVAEMGLNFRTYLSNTRFSHAVKDIALTPRPIGQIVRDNGFCSVRRFSVLFHERYGIRPSLWRRRVKAGTAGAETAEIDVPKNIQHTRKVDTNALFALLSRPANQLSSATHHDKNALRSEFIHPQFLSAGKAIKARRYVVVVGRFTELLKQHVQQQLLSLKAILPQFDIEMEDPLTRNDIAHHIHTGEQTPTWSPWSNIDLACCFLKQTGISPLIRLMPNEDSTDRLREFIHHNILLLGQEYVASWSFILDMGQHQTETATALNLKKLNLLQHLLPGCRIGLASHKGGEDTRRLPGELIAKIDFICFSISPNADHVSDAPEYKPPENQQIINRQLEIIVRHLKQHAIHCPVYIQSWSTLTGNNLMTNGFFFRGALLMDMLLSLPDEVTMLGVWLNSELQNEVSSSHVIENNSLSLFFIATSKRPIFHIIALRERLKGKVFDCGPGWMAISDGSVQRVLLLNTITINPLLSVQQHLIHDYSKRFTVRLTPGKAGIWRIKQWVFDQKNGALFHQYGLHPTRYDRDEETMRYISQRSEPTLSVRDERILRHWTTDIMMDMNAVCLLELTRIAE